MKTMTLVLALFVQQPQPAPAQTADPPVYSSPAVEALVERAAAANRAVPAGLQSYLARVETELSFVRAEPDGRETLLQIEQIASDVYWRNDGGFTQQLLGYRSETLGATFSALSFFDVPWLVPSLYGERLDLVRTGRPEYSAQGALLRRRAVHPFAGTREDVYRFSGGDTVDVVTLPGRRLPILRIFVEPHVRVTRPTLLFQGHIDLDATRMHIVRMEGRLIPAGRPRSPLSYIARGVLFVRFESAEYDEKYWLPRQQRFEAQAVSRLGEERILFRAISRFVDVQTNNPRALQIAADPNEFPYGRVIGGGDLGALSRFGDWQLTMGELNALADARDFDQYGPPGMVPGDEPRVTFGARYLSHIGRYNDVEGLFTGGGLIYDFGRTAPGLTLRLHGGYAWGEQTFRGGAEIARRAGGWEYLARAERQLAHTNDFLHSLEPEPGVPPLFAVDSYDFVDRRIASVVVRTPRSEGWSWRFETGRAGDRNVGRNVVSLDTLPLTEPPPVPDDDAPRLNRPAFEGDYWLARAEVRRNPSAGGLSLHPGLGLRLTYDGAVGELDWQRVEAGASLRRIFGRFTVALRGDAGTLLSSEPPPQALFELGTTEDLPGFDHKAFTGDRAALGRVGLMYTLPVLNAPIRLGAMVLPAIAPAPSASFQVGWTDATDETRALLDRFGWSTSAGARAAIDLRLRFFGGSVSVGAARPLETGARWRFVWGLAGGL
jgi:hypothetical protein